MTTIIRRTSSDLASMSRAAQRKERLLQIEREQRIEEAEALKMTEEQREILLRSFTSVKVEFSDLDGLKWTHSALRRRQGTPHPKSPGSPTPPSHAFVILTNADLASFSPEDTIRASAARPRPRFPSHSSPNLSRGSRVGSPANSRSPVNNHFPGYSPNRTTRHNESRRASDIEITPSFHATGYESDCDRTVRGGSDVESDMECESSSCGVGHERGRGKRAGVRRGKRRIRKSMAGDDGMVDNEGEDDGVWEDINGGAEVAQSTTIGTDGSTRSSMSASGVRLSTSQSQNMSLLRDTSLFSSVATPATPSKAPAFITYSSPTPRTINSSSSASSIPSPTTSSTQPIPPPAVPTFPRLPPNALLLGVPHPPTDPMQGSIALSVSGVTTAPQHTLLPGLSPSQPYICDPPLPLTRLPHRIRRTSSSSSSSLSPPASQASSTPLTSLPFPFTSSTIAPTPKAMLPNMETPTAPSPPTSGYLQMSTETEPRLASALGSSLPPTSSLSLPSRPEASAPGTLVVRGWNPSLSERENAHAQGTAALQGSPATAATNPRTTPDQTSAKASSLGC